MSRIFIDRFDTTLDIPAKSLTYDLVKEAVLKAGRFSVFEATDSPKRAKLFTMLHDDFALVTDNTRGYPWIYVRAATPEEIEKRVKTKRLEDEFKANLVSIGKHTLVSHSIAKSMGLIPE